MKAIEGNLSLINLRNKIIKEEIQKEKKRKIKGINISPYSHEGKQPAFGQRLEGKELDNRRD
jgi:hypothetical protein